MAATNTSKTDLQLTADAIGAHGVFFKKALRALLETIPGARILGEEYPVEGTAVDLLIEYKAPTILFVLPIECKRALASQKRWIFFRDSARSVKFAYTFSGAELNFSPLTTTGPGFANICVEGVEIDLLQLQKSPYSAASADRIYKAALQACKGGLGFVRSEFKARKKYPAGPHQDFSSFLLMVTTAPLSIAELPVGSVDLITGKHVGDLKLRRCSMVGVAFSFSAPNLFRASRSRPKRIHRPDKARSLRKGSNRDRKCTARFRVLLKPLCLIKASKKFVFIFSL